MNGIRGHAAFDDITLGFRDMQEARAEGTPSLTFTRLICGLSTRDTSDPFSWRSAAYALQHPQLGSFVTVIFGGAANATRKLATVAPVASPTTTVRRSVRAALKYHTQKNTINQSPLRQVPETAILCGELTAKVANTTPQD